MLTIPYHKVEFRLPDELVPHNSTSERPTIFHLDPAWGPDLARIKSMIFATAALVRVGDWSPEMQRAVTEAFGHGSQCFVNCVTKIDGLSVPVRIAERAGLVQADPTKPDTIEVPVTTGVGYSLIAAAPGLLPTSMVVASKIAEISEGADINPRFFEQPSGSGGPATAEAMRSTARNARPTSRRRGTAGNAGKTGGRT